jgi:hypothetical protein
VIELGRGRATEAIELLQPSNSYERDYLPAYIRGQASLVAHNGTAAAAEFQKLLDHRGIVQNRPIGALAHVQLGRPTRFPETKRRQGPHTKISSRLTSH